MTAAQQDTPAGARHSGRVRLEVHVFPNMDTAAIVFCDDSGWIRAKGLTYQIVELDALMTAGPSDENKP